MALNNSSWMQFLLAHLIHLDLGKKISMLGILVFYSIFSHRIENECPKGH